MSWVVLWIVIGLVLCAAEIFTGGFGILWFGLAAFAAAGIAQLGLGVPGQLMTFALGGLVLWFFTRRLTRRISEGAYRPTNARALLGQSAVVTRALGSPSDPYGYVRLHGEEWRATAPYPVPAGASVVVREIVGATLHVEIVTEVKEESTR